MQALLQFELGDLEAALAVLDAAPIDQDTCLLSFVRAMLAHRSGDHPTALKAFQKCLEFKDEPSLIAHRDGISGSLAYTGIGLVEAAEGHFEEAREAFNLALDQDPRCHQALAGSVAVARRGEKQHRQEVARRIEKYAAELKHSDALRRAASWMISLGEPDRARDLQKRSLVGAT